MRAFLVPQLLPPASNEETEGLGFTWSEQDPLVALEDPSQYTVKSALLGVLGRENTGCSPTLHPPPALL